MYRRSVCATAPDEAVHKPDELKIGGDPNWTVFFEERKRVGYVRRLPRFRSGKAAFTLQQRKKFDTFLPHASGGWTRWGFSQGFG
jgi:hypothetical protein